MGFEGNAKDIAEDLWGDESKPTQVSIGTALEAMGFEPIDKLSPMAIYTHVKYGIVVSCKQNSIRHRYVTMGRTGKGPLKIHNYVAKVISDYHLLMVEAEKASKK